MTTQQTKSNIHNRTIFTGDNLEILRGINSNCIDLIYLDPPFNSNRNYAAPIGSKAAGAAFKDTWTLNDLDQAWHNQVADKNLSLYKLIDASEHIHGRSMKSYLIMMAVRLIELNRVLKPEGSIYLHCDPTANHYIKMLMDTIFGAEKYKAQITWQRTSAHNDSKSFGNVCDLVLFYGSSDINTDAVRISLDKEYIRKTYRYTDEHANSLTYTLTRTRKRTLIHNKIST